MQLPTMYDVVPTIVKPATIMTRGGEHESMAVWAGSYAELCTQKAVDVFVSHWWGHEFSDFIKALEHCATGPGVAPDMKGIERHIELLIYM